MCLDDSHERLRGTVIKDIGTLEKANPAVALVFSCTTLAMHLMVVRPLVVSRYPIKSYKGIWCCSTTSRFRLNEAGV
jgi:hypothetical protein